MERSSAQVDGDGRPFLTHVFKRQEVPPGLRQLEFGQIGLRGSEPVLFVAGAATPPGRVLANPLGVALTRRGQEVASTALLLDHSPSSQDAHAVRAKAQKPGKVSRANGIG